MLKRIVSGLVLLALVAVCFIASKETTLMLIAVCAMISCYEFGNAMKKMNHKPITFIGFVFVGVSTLIIYFELGLLWLIALLGVTLFASFAICILSKKHSSQDALLTLSMLVYPCFPILMIMYVCKLPSPEWLVIFLTGFLSAVSCDTFAFFGGKLLGKHKLAPAVSPKKTIEGSISGMVVTLAIAIGAWFLFDDYINYSLWAYAIAVLGCTITSQVGDLSASFIKREAGIKDFSNLIPGHGGMLDRVDSIIFSIPTAYILLELFTRFRALIS